MNAVTPIREEGPQLFAIEAEQQVLGSLLLTPEQASLVDRLGGIDLFFDPVHARIFETIRDKGRAGELVDITTVGMALSSDEGLSQLGGRQYIIRLASAAISSHATKGYCEVLGELSRKRHIQAALSEATASLARNDASAAEISARLEGSIIALDEITGSNGPVSMLGAVADAIKTISAAYSGEDNGAVKTGIPALDSIVPGLFRGELTLLGGRPSMGKTAVALTMALNAARNGHGVVIASLEMTPEAMAMRALSEATSEAGNAVPYTSMRKGDMSEPQMRTVVQEAQYLGNLPITFLPRHYSDVGALVSGARQMARAGKLDLLIVDYAQLLRAEGRGRYEQITNISIALKALSVSLDIPVLALSQLSRDLEKRLDRRPMLSDLRESGQLEQDADNVLFCYREEYYLARTQPPANDAADKHIAWQDKMDAARGQLEVIVAKQRMGDIGTAHCRCALAMNRVWSD